MQSCIYIYIPKLCVCVHVFTVKQRQFVVVTSFVISTFLLWKTAHVDCKRDAGHPWLSVPPPHGQPTPNWDSVYILFFFGRPWYCSYGPGVVIPQIACHGSSKDVRTLDVSEAALSKAAGNGMHLPSAGFVALVATLCLTDLWLLQPPVKNICWTSESC